MGPGFGEAVLVHIGDGHWLVVDSCKHPDGDRAAPLSYLDRLGVDPAAGIFCVVVTHFDDDHVRGLAEVVEAAPNAKCVTALAMVDEDFLYLVSTITADRTRAGRTGLDEVKRAFQHIRAQGRSITYAAPNRQIFIPGAMTFSHGQEFELVSLSPADAETKQFLDWVATQLPKPGDDMRALPKRKRNDVSVVLSVRIGNEMILLGADLEEEGRPETGWSAVLASRDGAPWNKASVYKVAHHGSSTSHHAGVWSDMLTDSPTAVLAPWINGGHIEPELSDRARIIALAGQSFTTATGRTLKSPKRAPAVERTIKETVGELRSMTTVPGIVRLRRSLQPGATWTIELFEGASPLPSWTQ